MTKIVIATHGKLAAGFKQSIEFIMGKQPNLIAICAYTPECPDFIESINELIKNVAGEQIVFATDLLGGSVNNDLTKICQKKDNLNLVSGVNMSLLIQLLINIEHNDVDRSIKESISVGKSGIKDCTEIELSINEFDSF